MEKCRRVRRQTTDKNMIRLMRIACWITQATDTHSEYVSVSTAATITRTGLRVTLYRVSQEECARLREGVPYVKVYRYNPKHLCPKLNGYGDNGQRSLKL